MLFYYITIIAFDSFLLTIFPSSSVIAVKSVHVFPSDDVQYVVVYPELPLKLYVSIVR